MKFVELDFKVRDDEKTLQDRINELGERQESGSGVIGERPPPQMSRDGWLAGFSFDENLTAEYADNTEKEKQGKRIGTNDVAYAEGRIGESAEVGWQESYRN